MLARATGAMSLHIGVPILAEAFRLACVLFGVRLRSQHDVQYMFSASKESYFIDIYIEHTSTNLRAHTCVRCWRIRAALAIVLAVAVAGVVMAAAAAVAVVISQYSFCLKW